MNKLVGLLAIVMSLAFTLPALADEDKDKDKDKDKGGQVVIYDKDDDKKDDEKKDDKGGK